MAKMKLLPKTIEKKLKPIYHYDGRKPNEIPVPLKIFDPSGSGTWYLWEYDPEGRVFFGACKIHCTELGYVSLDDLESLRGKGGLPLERDLHWKGTVEDVIREESPDLDWMKQS